LNEDLIRSIVRDVVRRRLAAQSSVVVAAEPPVCVPVEAHPSHARLTLVRGADDGPCLIEPDVTCVHCGYCQSHGH
jgi:hypothetical protein